jgi:hypothetical protein
MAEEVGKTQCYILAPGHIRMGLPRARGYSTLTKGYDRGDTLRIYELAIPEALLLFRQNAQCEYGDVIGTGHSLRRQTDIGTCNPATTDAQSPHRMCRGPPALRRRGRIRLILDGRIFAALKRTSTF